MLEVASWLKVNTILVVPGAVDVIFDPTRPVVSYEVVYQRAQESLKKLVPLAEKFKVNIAIENVWNKFLLSPLEMRHFVDEFDSEYLGVYFDVGNVILYGYPEQWIKILGKRIKKVHFKDFKREIGTLAGFVNLLYGDVNWPAVIKALQDVQYDDYVIAELFPPQYYSESIIFGIIVDSVCEVLKLKHEEIEEAPTFVKNLNKDYILFLYIQGRWNLDKCLLPLGH